MSVDPNKMREHLISYIESLPPASINNLPHEIISNIFNNLRSLDLASFERTNKSVKVDDRNINFRQIAMNSGIPINSSHDNQLCKNLVDLDKQISFYAFFYFDESKKEPVIKNGLNYIQILAEDIATSEDDIALKEYFSKKIIDLCEIYGLLCTFKINNEAQFYKIFNEIYEVTRRISIDSYFKINEENDSIT